MAEGPSLVGTDAGKGGEGEDGKGKVHRRLVDYTFPHCSHTCAAWGDEVIRVRSWRRRN